MTKKMTVRKRDKIEKFSAMRFKPSMRKRVAPKKKEAPIKSIRGRERIFESSSKIIIRAIRPMPMGKLI
jgi:hypothetical protein